MISRERDVPGSDLTSECMTYSSAAAHQLQRLGRSAHPVPYIWELRGQAVNKSVQRFAVPQDSTTKSNRLGKIRPVANMV
jgi:hypothetical protein